jgi:AraC-like DNA-binding protein/quercetin dioxygenase-like cupin family protein
MMSQKRQFAIFDRLGETRAQISTHTQDYPAKQTVPLHYHNRDQLVYASLGVMTVRTSAGSWVVPADRAVWIPATVQHSITMSGTVAMRTLYVRPKLVATLPRECRVVSVSPLLKELILHACNLGELNRRNAKQSHVIDLIVDQLETIETVPLQLPNPQDPRAQRIAEVLLADPGNRWTLLRLCKGAGAGARTIERLFAKDVGMTFSRWRQQLRLLHAMRLLAEGAAVTHAALEAGYSTPSAFVSMFRRALGTTPGQYFKRTGEKGSRQG